ncbi:hypothetical protein SAMN04489761_4208 [Tenacibaculum sp. MAR_2009_124]|uniref:DUF6146 family protein n=1 Tax=Tenacibaculum sp. MAR_2009_124 TaxID=1250059 RepID=UPI00089A62DC|nr:DUF6146 family protein [Tenacibaculum sp. MAR_2009_124]SED08046.1 hypothetical protein SAMN04489761_4208 [Tenacibaculum sp. MAR_2009_124]
MSFLKNVLGVIVAIVIIISCSSIPSESSTKEKEKPVVIENDSLEYEIIIIDPGFNNHLYSIARPRGYHSLKYLEIRNRFLVPIWNQRVNNPSQFNPNIYENRINYDPYVEYGYEVNYLLFQYFQFAQRKYRMTLR